MSTVTEYEESGITKGKIARLAVSSMELEILNQEYNHNHNLSYQVVIHKGRKTNQWDEFRKVGR